MWPLCHCWQVLFLFLLLLVVVVVGGVDVVAYDFELRLRKRSEDIYSSMRRPDGESDDDPYSR